MSKNNGQLGRIESYIGTAKQSTEKFLYDHIGRLKESAEYRGDNNNLTYKQKFDFDRFGNLYRKAASNPTAGQANPIAYTPIEDADISKTTNRFATGTTYDDAGQVVNDTKFRQMSFAYDANGRQVKATRANVPDAQTVYDASGNRVATKINDVWQYVIYDAFGKLVAEYGVASEGLGGVKYIQQDWQGSVRTTTNSNGFVVARTDHQAFGDDIGYGIGLRSIEQGYSVGKVAKQGYGLTETDQGSGQQHTWFRKLETSAGRWTGPDPYNQSSEVSDPQSWNRFAYVGNDPINFIDPLGLDELSDAIAGASEMLKFKPCANMFRGKNAQSLLSNTKIKTLINQPLLYTSKGIVKWGKGWDGTTAMLTINSGKAKGIYFDPNGGFFWASVGIGFGISMEAQDFRVLAIIHELAHIARVIPDDGTSKTTSYENSRKVYVLCFVLNPKWRGNQKPLETTTPELNIGITPRDPISYYPGTSDADWAFFMMHILMMSIYWTHEPVVVAEEDGPQ